jgi:hypothetical protein
MACNACGNAATASAIRAMESAPCSTSRTETPSAWCSTSIVRRCPIRSAATCDTRAPVAISSPVAQATDAAFTSPRAICRASCAASRAVSVATNTCALSRCRVSAT